MGRRGPKPRRASNPAWTPELAYAVGLIATDGCLSGDGRHIDVTSKDVEQLNNVKHCLDLRCKIGSKQSSYEDSKYYRIQFGDVTLYRWLITIGITPRKSHTIAKVDVPDKYFFDYLRGEFDGDGSSHSYWDTRWRSSVCFYINFVCASRNHLFWINDTVQRLLGFSGKISGPYSKVHRLRFAKRNALKLYRAMFSSSNAICLSRKKEKIERQVRTIALAYDNKQLSTHDNGGRIITIT